jgi:hypothetical protein
MSTKHDVLRRIAVVTLSVLTALLVALTVLFMATGYRRQFDRGVADAGTVTMQLVLGASFLITAAFGASRLAMLWQGHANATARVARWAGFAIVLWLVWAYLRIGQYAS